MTSGSPGRKSTILDVAARAGVSRTSVSNYFHRPHKLSSAVHERIGEAMRELDFAPNEAARTLRTGRTPVVGYLAFELASARTPRIANAIGDALAARDLSLVLATDSGDVKREEGYLRLFERQRLSGVIVSPLGDIEGDLARLRADGMPSVLAGRPARQEEQPSVAVDHRRGGRLAAGHLLATGRRRLVFVTDSTEVPQIADRLLGARAVVASHPDATLDVLRIPHRDVDGGREAGRLLPEGVDGALCVNDLVAIGLTDSLVGRLRIPEDLAVVGYDDIEFAACNRVPLTTISTPQEELGATAARLLLEAIDRADQGAGPDEPDRLRVLYAPHLVVRQSSAR